MNVSTDRQPIENERKRNKKIIWKQTKMKEQNVGEKFGGKRYTRRR